LEVGDIYASEVLGARVWGRKAGMARAYDAMFPSMSISPPASNGLKFSADINELLKG
jgi:hypothetical protein